MTHQRSPVHATVGWWSKPTNQFVRHDLVPLPSALAGMRWPECPDDMQLDRMYPADQLVAIAERCVEFANSFRGGVPTNATHALISHPDFLAELLPDGSVGRCSLDVKWYNGIKRLSSWILRTPAGHST